MKKHTLSDITHITNELVNIYFPELKPIIIIFRQESDRDYYALGTAVRARKRYLLHIDEAIYDLPYDAIKGCLAYEFARIKQLHSMNFLELMSYRFKQILSKNARQNFNRELTKTVISKELSLELMEFRNHCKKGEKPYLLSDEIKSKMSVHK